MSSDPEKATKPDRSGARAPRRLHGRYRVLVANNWPLIAQRRSFGVPLADIWRELHKDANGEVIPYKAFLTHVREVSRVMAGQTSSPSPIEPAAGPRGGEAVSVEPPPAQSAPARISQKERFRLARERKEREEREATSAASPPPPPGKPDTRMIEGGEVWMSILGRERVRELARLNLQLRSREVVESDGRPILEAARREAWSKHLGIRADQLTEEDMNGPW